MAHGVRSADYFNQLNTHSQEDKGRKEKMTIDKIKRELTAPIFDHINSLSKKQLQKQQTELESDIKLIGTPGYFSGNCNDLLRIRNIELNYINYLLN